MKVDVTLKSGERIIGEVWEWRPEREWFSVVVDGPNSPVEVHKAQIAYGTLQRWKRTPSPSLYDLLTEMNMESQHHD